MRIMLMVSAVNVLLASPESAVKLVFVLSIDLKAFGCDKSFSHLENYHSFF